MQPEEIKAELESGVSEGRSPDSIRVTEGIGVRHGDEG